MSRELNDITKALVEYIDSLEEDIPQYKEDAIAAYKNACFQEDQKALDESLVRLKMRLLGGKALIAITQEAPKTSTVNDIFNQQYATHTNQSQYEFFNEIERIRHEYERKLEENNRAWEKRYRVDARNKF